MRTVLVLCGALLAGCQPAQPPVSSPTPTADSSPPASAPPASPAPYETSATDAWLGKWTGPEGTFLELSKSGADVVIVINSLDGPATYGGVGIGDEIQFERNGKAESIRATDGTGTGMKWLLDKKDCLTIQLGEGFCRD